MRGIPACAFACLLAGSGLAQEPGGPGENPPDLVQGPPASTTVAEPALKISGNRTTVLRYQHYSGLSPAASGFYQSGFTRHETTRLKVSGQALDTVKVEGEIFQSDVDFDNQYSLRLATRHYELFLGEFPASFEGSEFTLYNRQLQGAKLTGEVPLSSEPAPRIEFTAIGSSPRGRARYEKFFGTDTQGPYQLAGAPVVLGSEHVLVDKAVQTRNTDYEINYITGTITFKKRIVESRSLVEVNYEARETLYPRALYGGQVRCLLSDYDAFSLIGLDERDREDRSTYDLSGGTPATAHTVLGGTYKHDGEFLRYGGEYAHSFYDPNRFEGGLERGGAYKGELELERFGLLLGGDFKRMEPRYRAMGNTALGEDFAGWSAHGGFGIGGALGIRGEHRQQRTILGGSLDRLRSTDAKAEFSPRGWPRESYRFYQSEETFAASFDRTERRHTADISHELKHLALGSGYERQEITFRDGSQPNQTWDAGKASLGLRDFSWLSAALNGELRKGVESSSLFAASREFETAIGAANVAFTPHERYYLGGSNRWQKTTGKPAQNTLRTEAKAKPVDAISAQASFSQETLQMFYVGETKSARTDSYAALVEVVPQRNISLLYQPSLRETWLSGASPAINATRRDGYTAKWALGSMISAEGNFTAEDYRLRNTNDASLPIWTSQDADTWKTSLRLAPVRAFSSEVSYTDQTGSKAQARAAVPGTYDTRNNRRQTVAVGLKPQLESKLGLDAGYKFERFRQDGSQGAASSLPGYAISPLSERITGFSLLNDYSILHTHEHSVNGGASYQWLKSLISSVGATYNLKRDRLGAIPDVVTLAGNAGLTYRISVFKSEVTYRLAQSRGGADTFQQSVSGSLDFNPVPQVRWTNRAEYVASARPASANTDVTSSLEVSF